MHHFAYSESGAAAGIAVEFGEDNAVEVYAVVELACGVDGVLAGHCVNDEEGLVGAYGLAYGGNLVHHLLVYGEASGGIDDNYVAVFLFGVRDAVEGYLHGVHVPLVAVNGDFHRIADHLELLYGRGAVDVAGHEQGMHTL